MLQGGDIKRLIKSAENWQVESKLAKGGVSDTFWESYSAFANTDGGVIVLGVREQDGMRTIEGVPNLDQVTVTVQVELARSKSAVENAVNPAAQPQSAVKDSVKSRGRSKSAPKIVVKDAVKRTSPKVRPQVIDKCAELYQWLKDDPQRTVQQAVLTLGYSERSIFYYLETLKDASVLKHHGPANGGEWVFMI